jgi:hemerythrin superfamily protein
MQGAQWRLQMNRNAGRMIGAAGAAALGLVAGLALSRTKQVARKAGMALTGDWEKQLKAEHRSVRKLLKGMVDSQLGDAVERASLLASTDELLTRHGLEEEKVIYPALRTAGAGEAVELLFSEHAEMKTRLRGLQEMSFEDPVWAERAAELRRLFLRHIRTEEELFPVLRELGDEARNKALTALVRREAARVS